MRVDPGVVRRKFNHQISLMQDREDDLRQKGCVISKVVFPTVEAILQPRHPVHMPTRILLVDRADGRVVGDQRTFMPYPYLVARPFGIRLEFSDFDQQPPSLTFHDPQTWADLQYIQIPPGIMRSDDGSLQILISAHPDTGRPFLCMRFIREYHNHPEHTNQPWVWYRPEFNIANLLDRVADVFVSWPVPVVSHETSPGDHAAL